MQITNETIIKAAKAAGLNIQAVDSFGSTILLNIGDRKLPVDIAIAPHFNPLHNDTDNAMIMDGAEINIVYAEDAYKLMVYIGSESVEFSCVDSKVIARRNAVILCAAAKWDAKNRDVK